MVMLFMSLFLNRKISCNILHLTGAMTRYLPGPNVDIMDTEKLSNIVKMEENKKKEYPQNKTNHHLHSTKFANLRDVTEYVKFRKVKLTALRRSMGS